MNHAGMSAERLLAGYGARTRIALLAQQWLQPALNDLGAVRVRHPGNFRLVRGMRRADQLDIVHLPEGGLDPVS